MNSPLSRRDLLKVSLLSLWSLAFQGLRLRLPEDERHLVPLGRARVTADWITVREGPSFYEHKRLEFRRRDQIIPLLEEVISEHGPTYNPRWYRTLGGFVHSGHLQRFEPQLHPVLDTIPESGQLGELTIAYAQSYRYFRITGWQRLYRLYFSSVHWITGLEIGPDGRTPWYQITDERLRVNHYLPAQFLRPIPFEEITPLSPEIPPDEKSIRVTLEDQILTAYEGQDPVFKTKVSTGLHSDDIPDNGIPTDTPVGRFYISNKRPSRHMGDGELTSEVEAYELLGVPWCCYFVSTGVAFHGTYWHNNFGVPMSHGCVNMRNQDAKWLYRWTAPTLDSGEWYRLERGTRVDIVE
jgi:hypothetical protein